MIQEEVWPGEPHPVKTQTGTPAISVTDELGDQRILADSCDACAMLNPDEGGGGGIPALLNSEQLQKTVSGSFEVALSEFCSQLATPDILGLVEKAVSATLPPSIHSFSTDNTLALEYPCGLQVELQVLSQNTQLKMRRISGDQGQYSALCHQLVACMSS